MPRKAVTSNFQKFNKNQRALIARFGFGVNSSIISVMGAAMELASDTGIETINFRDRDKKQVPITVKGQRIYNPILGPKGTYKQVSEQKDTKKVLNRTGALKSAFDFFAAYKMSGALLNYADRKPTHYLISDEKRGVQRLRIGFLGAPAMALNNVSNKSAKTRLRDRRRFVESAFGKVKSIFKKSMINKRLMNG